MGFQQAAGKVLETQERNAKGREHSRAQIYRGEGVRLRAHQLKSSNKALARAMKDFDKRGLEPNWDQSMTVLDPSSNSTATISGRALQRVSYPQTQTWSDGSYELTLITYSNSSSQWEGILYFNNPNEDDTYEARILTPSNAEWDTAYEYWYPPDGGDPQCGGGSCPLYGISTPRLLQAPKTRLVNASYSAEPMGRRGIWGRIKQWAKCVWQDAVAGAYFCSSLWCWLGEVGSAILNC